jgi:hypothetical protein
MITRRETNLLTYVFERDNKSSCVACSRVTLLTKTLRCIRINFELTFFTSSPAGQELRIR